MKAIKVVRREKDNLYSIIQILPKLRVQYIVNEYVRPRKGFSPLCTFEKVKQAEEFIKKFWIDTDCEIWECEIEESKQTTLEYHGFCINMCDLPSGTILADKARLTRPLKIIKKRKRNKKLF